MAMTVLYNSRAQLALSNLNKNNLQANKSLSKLASGEKFVGAQGESASYAISEKMREQLRSLFQDDQNVQNGSSMVKTAERAIDQIVQNLRTMKELAIDAANDSNTDDDRRIIQKEIDQRREVINDIALGTKYNGKILLDGRYTGGLVSLTNGGGGANTTIQNISQAFSAGNNATTGSQSTNGGSGAWQFNVDASFTYSGRGDFAVELDFSNLDVTGSYPNTLQGQGFTILCGGCYQYINIRFDATKTSNQSTYDRTPGVADDGTKNTQAREFIIGVKNVRSGSALAKAIFDGVAALKVPGTYAAENSSNDVLLDQSHNVRIKQDSNGRVFIIKSYGSPELQFMEGTITNPLTLPLPEVEVEEKPSNPLWVQHGTQAGQRINVFIDDMQTKALGIDKAEVTTRENATNTIGIIESAIEIALDEATNMGAYLQRLETAFANVMTMRENAQGSESVIRDADMAEEITEYMKYNILSQSAQAMLAQANTDGTFVLGMLQ